nr:MAG TPA: hypothetical protein [Caudoviricetes sp.]DAV66906.1 MAG TPA: hypothetical protein [Caudoviricetes sp.]
MYLCTTYILGTQNVHNWYYFLFFRMYCVI